MEKEGVIKYHCHWIKHKLIYFESFEYLNDWRNCLYNKGLIGVNAEGIGYGNISIRFYQNQFIISGSGTGNIELLSKEHYSLVKNYNIKKNSLTALGPLKASSESLTHAAVYQSDSSVNAVIHVHHFGLWKKYLNLLPTSNPSVEYGTPAMANEIKNLLINTDLPVKKIMIMGGHQEGILTFGNDLDEAGQVLLDYFNH